MTLAPAEPSPFPQLLNRLIDNDVPFRISFLIESAGAQGNAFRAFAAGVLGFYETRSINKSANLYLRYKNYRIASRSSKCVSRFRPMRRKMIAN